MTSIRYLGSTDDFTTCDHCGRQNLKSTVALSIDGDEPVYYGVTCAARALRGRGVRTDTRTVREETAKVDREREQKEAAERARVYRETVMVPWFAWLDERVPEHRGEPFRQIEALGGYAAANAAYTAATGKIFKASNVT